MSLSGRIAGFTDCGTGLAMASSVRALTEVARQVDRSLSQVDRCAVAVAIVSDRKQGVDKEYRGLLQPAVGSFRDATGFGFHPF